MRKHGFTIVELMVAVTIMGILASVTVPKVMEHAIKAKASEISPAAMTYTKLQSAYLYEHKALGTWKKIGYAAPGGKNAKTDNFKYSKGDITGTIKASRITTDLAEEKIVWQAENRVGLGGCHVGNQWQIKVSSVSDTEIEYKPYMKPTQTSSACVPLARDWGNFQAQVSMNTPPARNPGDASTPTSSETVAVPSVTSSSSETVVAAGGTTAQSSASVVSSSSVYSSSSETKTAFYDEEEDFTDEDDGSCGTMYTKAGNRCPPSWCKLNGNVSRNHGGWSKSGHKWNECYVARQALIQEAADAGLVSCKNKNNCHVSTTGTTITIKGNKISTASEESSNEEYESAEAIAAGSTFKTASETEAKAYFGYVEVLCAGKNNKKAGCEEWRRASECTDKNWASNGKCTNWAT